MVPTLHALAPLLERLGRPTRRELLRWSAIAGAALVLRTGRARADQSAPSSPLDPQRRETLEAAVERILPSGEAAGAREAKVMRFIERQLAGELSAIVPALAACASLLDQWAQRNYGGRAFAALEAEAQDRVLRDLSRGAIPAPTFPQREVFAALHTLTLEGFLSDPSHGGNDQMIGWRALGIAPMHRRTRVEAAAEDGASATPRSRRLRIVP